MSDQKGNVWPKEWRWQAREMRARGKSYQTIALALAARNGVEYLSWQSVRNWCK